MDSANLLSATVMPSATPTEAEIAAWQSLPRDEQLRRFRAYLTQPDCQTISTASMDDIWAEIEADDTRQHG